MLRLSNTPIVCGHCAKRRQSLRSWRCAAASLPVAVGKVSNAVASYCCKISKANRFTRKTIPGRSRRFTLSALLNKPSVETTPQSSHPEFPAAQPPQSVPIRKYLRDWASQNGVLMPPDTLPSDSGISAQVGNIMSRPQATGSTELDTMNFETPDLETEASFGEERWLDDFEQLSVENNARTPGDLVELSPRGSRTSLLAVFIGYIGGINHFYGSNGRWIISRGFASRFSVAKFSTPAEIAPIVAQIPADGGIDTFEKLRNSGEGPSAQSGRHLVAKMAGFTTKVKGIYQSNISRLDNAQALTAAASKTKYLSLIEISELILPASLRENGVFPPYVLYAVHLALFRHEVGFSPMSPSADSHRRDHLFEILSQAQLHAFDTVVVMVRDHIQRLVTKDPQKVAEIDYTKLGKFIKQAKEEIIASRRERRYFPTGMLTKSTLQEQKPWSASSIEIINFLEQWAAHDIFTDGSKFHAYGSLILRFLGLYHGAKLDQRTAWNFLQEIGWIQPWELPSRYKTRLPRTKMIPGAGIDREVPSLLADSERRDCAEGQRHDWGQSPVFCIDAPSTTLIDDGISLERTEAPDAYWIHIHVADPASAITPKSDLASYLELIPENIYLPGHAQSMLPDDLGHSDTDDMQPQALADRFSLKAGSPTLTFSAKVNNDGDILDRKVQAGMINNVINLAPEDVTNFCDEPKTPKVQFPHKTLEVGRPPDEWEPVRDNMTVPEEMDQGSKDDLMTLSRLNETLRVKRLARGAWPYFIPGLSVSVSTPQTEKDKIRMEVWGPHIKVSQDTYAGCSLTTNSMILAGEIAAHWCSDRGIPIPYRKDTTSAENFAEALSFVQNSIYPMVQSGIDPPPGLRAHLMQLTGPSQLSDTPGPYFTMGVDKYAKATSPLRRYGDLLAHWQIHAALAFEREHRRQIDPTTDSLDSILPFTLEEMPNILALLHTREKMCRTIAHGAYEWILIALYRAWRVERNLPRTFRFTVLMKWKHSLSGAINLFDLEATLQIRDINGIVLAKDVNVGDKFDVELLEINVPSRLILVRALRFHQKMPSGTTKPASEMPSQEPKPPASA